MKNRLTARYPAAILFAALLASPSTGGAGNGGSTYSRFGLGDLRLSYSAQSLGMAGSGLTVRSGSGIDQNNPAAWSGINRTRYTVGALYEGFSSSDGVSSTFLSAAEFNGAMIAIPVSPSSGVVLGLGITPFSRTNYDIVTPFTQSNLDYTLRFTGEGGLSQTHLGLSATLWQELHLGAKLNYYFGTLRHTVKQDFSSSQYTNAEVTRSTQLRGAGVTFGLIYGGLGKLLGLPEDEQLAAGGFVSSAANLTAEQEDYFSYTASGLTTRDTAAFSPGDASLPAAFGAGISYATARVLLAADLQYQHWYAYTVAGVHPAEIRDSYRFSLGGELIPKRDPASPFTERIAYRAGVSYHQTYYRVKGEPINEFGLSGGFGIPVFGDTRFHIAAEYAVRGTTEKQLQKDKILRISFTLTGGELWFVRPVEE